MRRFRAPHPVLASRCVRLLVSREGPLEQCMTWQAPEVTRAFSLRCPAAAVSKWWYLALSCVIALLFSAYLVYDIQLLIGGKSVALSPDEYVFGSLQIYLGEAGGRRWARVVAGRIG